MDRVVVGASGTNINESETVPTGAGCKYVIGHAVCPWARVRIRDTMTARYSRVYHQTKDPRTCQNSCRLSSCQGLLENCDPELTRGITPA